MIKLFFKIIEKKFCSIDLLFIFTEQITKTNHMNTQIKKSANGKVYQISTSFKVGNKVAVHNSITGEISYTGIIKNYRFNKKAKYNNHFAQIVIAGLNGYKENLLGTALVIN